MKNDNPEAIRIWNIGKDLGFSYTSEDDILISILQSMENRDSSKLRYNRMESSVSDDENN